MQPLLSRQLLWIFVASFTTGWFGTGVFGCSGVDPVPLIEPHPPITEPTRNEVEVIDWASRSSVRTLKSGEASRIEFGGGRGYGVAHFEASEGQRFVLRASAPDRVLVVWAVTGNRKVIGFGGAAADLELEASADMRVFVVVRDRDFRSGAADVTLSLEDSASHKAIQTTAP